MKNSMLSLSVSHHLKKGLFQSNATIPGLLLLLLLTACQPAAPDYEAEYRPLIDKFLEIYNTGNLSLVEEIYTPDAIRHSNKELKGHQEIREGFQQSLETWPQMKVDLIEAIYAPNKAVFHWLTRGTDQRGGKPLEVHGISIFTIADGKVTDDFRLGDFGTAYQKLGYTLTPPPADSTLAKVGEGNGN